MFSLAPTPVAALVDFESSPLLLSVIATGIHVFDGCRRLVQQQQQLCDASSIQADVAQPHRIQGEGHNPSRSAIACAGPTIGASQARNGRVAVVPFGEQRPTLESNASILSPWLTQLELAGLRCELAVTAPTQAGASVQHENCQMCATGTACPTPRKRHSRGIDMAPTAGMAVATQLAPFGCMLRMWLGHEDAEELATSAQAALGGPVAAVAGRDHQRQLPTRSAEAATRAGSTKTLDQQQQQEVSDWLSKAPIILGGALSRMIAQAATYPIDTLKTRLQVSTPLPPLNAWRAAAAASCMQARAAAARLDLGRAAAAILAAAGPGRELYLGLAGAMAGTLPAAAVYFSVDEAVKGWMEGHGGALGLTRGSLAARVAASTAAAAVSGVFRVPTDVLKHRVQAYVYPGVAQAARCVLAAHGPAGLYSGFGATLLRDAPETVIQFMVYDALRNLVDSSSSASRCAGACCSGDAAQSGTGAGGIPGASCCGLGDCLTHMSLGAAAGATAAFATMPLDVVKTELQCSGGGATFGGALSAVLRQRGPAGLFSGLGPRLLQTTLSSALFFTCFELCKREAAKQQQQQRLPEAPVLAHATPAAAPQRQPAEPVQAQQQQRLPLEAYTLPVERWLVGAV